MVWHLYIKDCTGKNEKNLCLDEDYYLFDMISKIVYIMDLIFMIFSFFNVLLVSKRNFLLITVE